MRDPRLERVEADQLTKQPFDLRVGDWVDVGTRVVEGDKERAQVFTGRVIARQGKGVAETFTVRRDSANVERTFPLHSPHLALVHVVRSGKSRRAKLYYLRKRVGKATRLAERRREEQEPSDSAESPPEAPTQEPGEARKKSAKK